ncbi:uncharacterized protein N0V89_006270 [Didymosphaeria variabile]|uniref:Magnesium transporter n=1 Tax=Didymosphaeria variabile TaxID=1932322 RepID=A0A9W9CCI2_9PLEO|nr:uncharacterized protein N0V89_006270 [Didymosphaeria variabile]KAJ4354533.1 hypothetical protein N0V89_006270 [Didymosphaeria variabile]
MAILGTALNAVGLIFLTHAVYSSHEHTAAFAHTPLPLDITIELLVSIFVLSAGIVVSSPQLKPIQWAKWGGKIAREGQHGEGKWTREGEEILSEGDGFAFLGLDTGIGGNGEGRRGFWDVRSKRKEYAEWAKAGGK